MTNSGFSSSGSSLACVSSLLALVLECALLPIARLLPEREGFYFFWLGLAVITLLAFFGIVVGSSFHKRLHDRRALVGFVMGEVVLVALVVGLFVVMR